ncbi:MAG: hypothetical protein J2O46_07655, partial [Nocardioides sp.]|nr:hypothetical protein [Nocardioides sp.]
LAPYADRYLDAIGSIESGGMLNLSLPIRFYPRYADADFIASAHERLAGDGLIPVVRQSLLNIVDTLERQLAARHQ